jgi:hypothetical protein
MEQIAPIEAGSVVADLTCDYRDLEGTREKALAQRARLRPDPYYPVWRDRRGPGYPNAVARASPDCHAHSARGPRRQSPAQPTVPEPSRAKGVPGACSVNA